MKAFQGLAPSFLLILCILGLGDMPLSRNSRWPIQQRDHLPPFMKYQSDQSVATMFF